MPEDSSVRSHRHSCSNGVVTRPGSTGAADASWLRPLHTTAPACASDRQPLGEFHFRRQLSSFGISAAHGTHPLAYAAREAVARQREGEGVVAWHTAPPPRVEGHVLHWIGPREGGGGADGGMQETSVDLKTYMAKRA